MRFSHLPIATCQEFYKRVISCYQPKYKHRWPEVEFGEWAELPESRRQLAAALFDRMVNVNPEVTEDEVAEAITEADKNNDEDGLASWCANVARMPTGWREGESRLVQRAIGSTHTKCSDYCLVFEDERDALSYAVLRESSRVDARIFRADGGWAVETQATPVWKLWLNSVKVAKLIAICLVAYILLSGMARSCRSNQEGGEEECFTEYDKVGGTVYCQ